MRQSERMQCQCGCAEFSIWKDKDDKGRITMVCQYCGCRRGVSSPGVAVDHYAMDPVLIPYVKDFVPRPEHTWPPDELPKYRIFNEPLSRVLGQSVEDKEVWRLTPRRAP